MSTKANEIHRYLKRTIRENQNTGYWMVFVKFGGEQEGFVVTTLNITIFFIL